MSWLGDLWDDVVDFAEEIAPVALLVFGGYYIYTALEASAAIAAGMSVAEAEAAGISLASMAEAGLTASEAVAAGAGAESCLAAYSAAECYTAGIGAAELMSAGATGAELLAAGASIGELAAGGATVGSLIAEGATASELLYGGASVGELVEAGATAGEMLNAGATTGELLSAGMSAPEVISGASLLGPSAEHVVATELLNTGYTVGELASMGASESAIAGGYANASVLSELGALAPGETFQGLTGSQWAAVNSSVDGGALNAMTSLGATPEQIYSMTQVGYTPAEIMAAANEGTLTSLAADAGEYLAWAGEGAGVAGAGTSAVSADLIAAAEASADPIGTMLQGMGYGASSVSPEVIAAAEASADPIGSLIAGIEAGGSGEAAVTAATEWTGAGYGLGEFAGVDEAVAANAAEAAAAPLATDAEMAAAAAEADAAAGAGAGAAAGAGAGAGAGLTATDIALGVAAGTVLPGVIGGLLGPKKPSTGSYYDQFLPIPKFEGGGTVNPGVNPGFIKPQPIYNPEGTPGINQYNWGSHGYVPTYDQMSNYDMYAPAQPYGNQNAQNLGKLITPEQIGYPSLQSAQATQGTATPTYYNPVPVTPGVAQMQQQMLAPVQPTPMAIPQAGGGIHIAQGSPLASTNTSGTMTPNQYADYLNALALEAGTQP